MSSTIRSYRHSPTQSADPTGSLVDTETDADDGPFTVTVDTTGWSPGSYEVSVTREYTTGGLSESAKSNPLAVTAASAGNSDAFGGSGAMGANWGDLGGGPTAANLEQSAGYAQATGDYAEAGARYTTSSADISQAVFVAMGDAALASDRWLILRCDGSGNYYSFRLYDNSSGNFVNWQIWREGTGGGYINGGAIAGGPYSRSSNHTFRFTASGTSTVTLTGFVDGNQIGQGTDSTSPLSSGSPGIRAYGNAVGGQANTLFDNWQDT